MFKPREHENLLLFCLRWTARLASVVCLAIIILFFFGEGFDPRSVETKEWVGFVFFPVGVFVGLVLAWSEEGLGGAIVIFSVIAFYLVYGWLLSGRLWQGWAFLPFLLPGVLFLIYKFISSHVDSQTVN